MSNWKISRRIFMTAGGAALVLPAFESLGVRTARAAGTTDPKRFVAMYMPCGTYNVPTDEVWYQNTGAITASNLGTVMAPFTANVGDFSIVKHLKTATRDKQTSIVPEDHFCGVSTFLNAQNITGGQPSDAGAYIPGTSFDQTHAQSTGKGSLVLGTGDNSGSTGLYASVSNLNNKLVQPVNDPNYLFNQMFASLSASSGPAAPQPSLVRNKSILDTSTADLQDLSSKLGKTDATRLDDYLTSLRALETQLASSGLQATSQCQPIPAPDPSGSLKLSTADIYGNLQNFNPKMKAFLDMIVLAFKCDLVRTVTLMYDGEGSARTYGTQIGSNLLGLPTSSIYYGGLSPSSWSSVQDHIGVSHYLTSGFGKNGTITRDRYRMTFMMYLVNALKAAKDASGTAILDNTIVLNGYNVRDGAHQYYSGNNQMTPIIVAGGKNLGLHPGQSIEAGTMDMKDLFYSFSTALGMNLANWGGNTGQVAL